LLANQPIFTQLATKATELRQNKSKTMAMPFKVIRGHRFWYQSKAHMRLPIRH